MLSTFFKKGSKDSTENDFTRTVFGAVPVRKNTDSVKQHSAATEDVPDPLTQSSLAMQQVSAVQTSGSDFLENVANLYAEGDSPSAVNALQKSISESPKTNKDVWFMLLDILQAENKKEEFDKAAIDFAQTFGSSPPSWEESENKEEAGNKNNVIVFDPILRPNYPDTFRNFLNGVKKEKFCRININQFKFEQNPPQAIKDILDLFVAIRKQGTTAVLIGEAPLMDFCKKHISGESQGEFAAVIEEIWMLYFEVLQWKGKQEEFEDLALEYADKFEISPPSWESSHVMSIEGFKQDVPDESEQNTSDSFSPEGDLSDSVIEEMFGFIDARLSDKKTAEVDFSHVHRINFATAGLLSFRLQEIQEGDIKQNIVFKSPNKPVQTILKMIGLDELITITPKARK